MLMLKVKSLVMFRYPSFTDLESNLCTFTYRLYIHFALRVLMSDLSQISSRILSHAEALSLAQSSVYTYSNVTAI
jgi:hypothetical protein